jgi:hypothetical protein
MDPVLEKILKLKAERLANTPMDNKTKLPVMLIAERDIVSSCPVKFSNAFMLMLVHSK